MNTYHETYYANLLKKKAQLLGINTVNCNEEQSLKELKRIDLELTAHVMKKNPKILETLIKEFSNNNMYFKTLVVIQSSRQIVGLDSTSLYMFLESICNFAEQHKFSEDAIAPLRQFVITGRKRYSYKVLTVRGRAALGDWIKQYY